MKNWLFQIVVLLFLSAVVGLTINAARPGGIALVGNWPTRTAAGDDPVEPPSAEPGDPRFITLDDAVTEYQNPDIIFIDARSPEDFEYGRIARSINIPYDYMDEHWEAVLDSLDRTRHYVVYCSGSECEVSLHLGRYMQDLGFKNLDVFFGGWAEWEQNGLPMEGYISEEGAGK
jgi:rhodanese-related sulfurtransferase